MAGLSAKSFGPGPILNLSNPVSTGLSMKYDANLIAKPGYPPLFNRMSKMSPLVSFKSVKIASISSSVIVVSQEGIHIYPISLSLSIVPQYALAIALDPKVFMLGFRSIFK